MARALRTDFAGAVHHVTSRGNERRPIFHEDDDRLTFLRFLGDAARRFRWSVTAYVLMTNHFHLVIQTPEPSISRGMHWLNTRYAIWFNRRHERVGHLFQGRFKALLIEKEQYFAQVLRYVALNPVRAGMVTNPADYRWSSFAATAGLDAAPDWLDVRTALDTFAPEESTARQFYRDFVEQESVADQQLWTNLVHGMFLGSDRWIRSLRKFVEAKPRSSEHPREQRAVGRPKMHRVVEAVARAAATTSAKLRMSRGGPLRRLAAWIGWHEGWLTLANIAAGLRLRSEGHISNLIRMAEREFGRSSGMLTLLDTALATIRA